VTFRRVVSTTAVLFVLLCVGSATATGKTVSTMDSTMNDDGSAGPSTMDSTMGDDGSAGPTDADRDSGDQDTADRDTSWGPLSQNDRNLLINVRWANLWEGPTSGQVAAHTTNPKVKAVATQLSTEHHVLDELVTQVAARLNVTLPNQPTPLQQSWVNAIESKTGNDADALWANVTREAHGTVFMFIAQVRSETRNDAIRSFAQTANEYVMRHMTLLESTGLVWTSSLVVGSAAGAPFQILPSWLNVIFGVVLVFLVIMGTFLVVRMLAQPAGAVRE
jgi:predicted outer membrane protein